MDRWELINRSIYDSWILYGQLHTDHKTYYGNIYQSPELVEMCYCDGDILKLYCTLHKIQNNQNFNEYDPHYFGWINFEKNSELEHVWPSLIQCEMCVGFEAGTKEKEMRGEGVVVRLNIENLGLAPQEDYTSRPIVEESEIEFEEIIAPVKRRRKIIWRD